jgi:hypothetical protein
MEAIRKIIKPEGNRISIELPLNMASKMAEVIILPIEEKPVKRAYGTAKGKRSVPLICLYSSSFVKRRPW